MTSGRVPPLLKWPGGKRRELDGVLAALPDRPARLHEPFVGGGAVWLAAPPDVPAVVNDASPDLMAFYCAVAAGDAGLLTPLDALAEAWTALRAMAGSPEVTRVAEALRGADSSTTTTRPAPVVEEHVAHLADAAARAALAESRGLAPLVGTGLARRIAVAVSGKVDRARRLQRERGEPLDEADRVANVVGALHAGVYTAMRAAFNDLRRADAWPSHRPALFWAMRELSYAAMFRRNADGDFNVPFGGITYSRKDLATKVAHLRSAPVAARLANTTLRCGDAATALHDVGPDDAVFLDPPYDTDFSAYDGRPFGWDDQVRLEALARDLPCPVVAVLKDTPRIRELWSADRWWVEGADHRYAWTIKSRNDRRTRHLLVRSPS